MLLRSLLLYARTATTFINISVGKNVERYLDLGKFQMTNGEIVRKLHRVRKLLFNVQLSITKNLRIYRYNRRFINYVR